MWSGSTTTRTPPEPAPGPLFPQTLLDSLGRYPDRTAFAHGSRHVTYAELLAMVRSQVDLMRNAGIGPGRGVAMITGITPEAFAANVAVHTLGCRVAGIRPGWSRPHLASVLDEGIDAVVGDPSTLTPELVQLAGPAALLSLGPHSDAVDLLARRAPADRTRPEHTLTRPAKADHFTPPDAAARQTHGHHISTDLAEPTDQAEPTQPTDQTDAADHANPTLDHRNSRNESAPITVEARPDDIARLNFTSGSTGQPKGCARTYRTFSLAYQPDRWAPDLARLMECFERVLVYSSWSIPVRLTFAARCLVTGGTVVIADAEPGGSPHLPRAIEQHRVTGVAMNVPALHRTLAQLRDDPVDVGCLRAVVVSGSPASPDLLAAAIDLLGPVVWQGYGQAESGMISLLTPQDIARHPDSALASVGRPLPEVQISVRDGEGRPVGPAQTGEIYVRGPQVMAGYWREPEGTSELLGEDGWLRTHDLGHLDESTGLLHLTGRSRDVIMVNAEVCYAGAIEQVLARHPDVDQAYVVGVPDDRTGEAVHAFVVPRASGDEQPSLGWREGAARGDTQPPERRPPDRVREELAGLVRAELTPGHVPETITAVTAGEVPVAASGKPDKQALADIARPVLADDSGLGFKG